MSHWHQKCHKQSDRLTVIKKLLAIVTRFWKTLCTKFDLLLVMDTSSLLSDRQPRHCDHKYCCWVINVNMNGFDKALFWEKNVFVVQLLMWACLYIHVNCWYYKHATSCRKRWCLIVTANGWHKLAIRNLSRCFSAVSGCPVPCFIFLEGEHLCIQTGNHGNTLYCVYTTHGKRSLQFV